MGNIWSVFSIVKIKIRLAKVVALLVESKRVVWSSVCGIWNLVERLDARRSDVKPTAL